mmetsp:Transcript_3323/g.8186  ORF Transcript_3323/g.8186 Transcript_3323/m.8186 type:complete len:223 (-) Transcript_3323:2307-2975(-)
MSASATGPWSQLGAAVADIFDIPRPQNTRELEEIVNRLFTRTHFEFDATPQSVIDALEEHALTEEEKSAHVQCTICLGDLATTDSIVKLECTHLFHRHCVTPWLSRQSTCPLCRHQLGSGAQGTSRRDQTDEESIQLARMLAHFTSRIVSGTGIIPPPRRRYPSSSVNSTTNPYAHYRPSGAAHPEGRAGDALNRPIAFAESRRRAAACAAEGRAAALRKRP